MISELNKSDFYKCKGLVNEKGVRQRFLLFGATHTFITRGSLNS
ncbi:hypothetical protein ICM_05642 [Bacillus cereus BAG1X2-3]|nr:hypothetical protein ICC_05993 [Bacillus cereus BAG1X1-1]EOO42905.1 hypothetical protein ICI_06220 [Bacillus cereus BAG1X2-1]EOO56445.1 hypothetical protein ICM_05642 [Bacillus cereus BAG1X2-3]EOP00245.1 hypothetical protein ICO_06495 [Bacillus cereus BAG2O-1]